MTLWTSKKVVLAQDSHWNTRQHVKHRMLIISFRTETIPIPHKKSLWLHFTLTQTSPSKHPDDTIIIYNSCNMFNSKSCPSDLSVPASLLVLVATTMTTAALLSSIAWMMIYFVWMMIYFLLPRISSGLRRITFIHFQRRMLNTTKALSLRRKGMKKF